MKKEEKHKKKEERKSIKQKFSGCWEDTENPVKNHQEKNEEKPEREVKNKEKNVFRVGKVGKTRKIPEKILV